MKKVLIGFVLINCLDICSVGSQREQARKEAGERMRDPEYLGGVHCVRNLIVRK